MRVEENLREAFSEIAPGSCLYQRDKIKAFVWSQVYELRNVFNNKNSRKIFLSFCHERGTKKQLYYTMRNRVLDICISRLRSTTETLRWVRPWSGWKLRFKTYHLSHSVHKSSGDRLEKLDQVEGLIKDATEDWNSIQKAFKDAYPCEGHMIHSLFSTN